MNGDGLVATPGSRLFYHQLHPPQDAPHEEFRPEIHRAIVDSTVLQQLRVLPPTDGMEEDFPPIFLMRENNPQFAYGLLSKVPIKLNHHAPNWGEIYFAVVFRCISPGVFQAPSEDEVEFVAVKCLSKPVIQQYLQQGGRENPYKEIDRMQELGDNEHVLMCKEALECDKYLYIVTPKACEEGTLKDVITWMDADHAMDPDRVRSLFRQVLKILIYLEDKGICHHDVSPDNFLFLRPDKVVIFDLALSMRMPRNSKGHRTLFTPQGNYGTHAWMDPSVFAQGIVAGAGIFDGVAYDLWAGVIILYNMLTNHILYGLPHPVDLKYRFFIMARALSNAPQNELAVQALTEIMHGDDERNQHEIVAMSMANLNISPQAMEVLENVLKVQPHERWTLAQVIESTYVQHGDL